MTVMVEVPPIVLDYLLDKAMEAMETGNEISVRIHGKGRDCGEHCLVHKAA